MRRLLKNGTVVNVFTGCLEQAGVLIEADRIIGVGDYRADDATIIEDVTGKYICPGFIDGHIHIESSMLLPAELARTCVPHGTTSIVADPHEIANVCGRDGIEFMLEASRGIPMAVYLMLPSCVPATRFDESGAVLLSEDLRPLYDHPRVLGLGEMMNYPGVLAGDPAVLQKIEDARASGKRINGHAPLLSGRDLDRYIAAGIQDDHECSSCEEAIERIRKGQWVMIRQGTAARNLQALLPLFEEPYAHRCLLVSDDRHPADLLRRGHIDCIIREAVSSGKSPVVGIQMATIQAAQCFGLQYVGAVAPGYMADVLVLSDLNSVQVEDVYYHGNKVVTKEQICPLDEPEIAPKLREKVHRSFSLQELSARDFYIEPAGKYCRIIKRIPDQLLTEEWISELNFKRQNGIDIHRDILKLAVLERHKGTGHRGLGFISGVGLQKGAIASSVAHDSHNLIVIGANESDMATAANRICQLGGGSVVVLDGRILAEMPLPVAGLMSDRPVAEISRLHEKICEAAHALGVPEALDSFMAMAFVSLPVIPDLKMTTLGLVDVRSQQIVPLFV